MQTAGSNGIRVDRLKDKLGTRKVPTAELTLDGARAVLIGQPRNGTRAIEPMLGVTRMWNSVCAAAFMRRGLALARAYAAQREAFGEPLDAPAAARRHAGDARGGNLGRVPDGVPAGRAARSARRPARSMTRSARCCVSLTPLTKLATGKQAVADDERGHRVVSAAQGTSRTPGCRSCCATHRCCRSGKARRTCCRSMRCCGRTFTPGSRRCSAASRRAVFSLTEPRLAAAGRQAVAAIERVGAVDGLRTG